MTYRSEILRAKSFARSDDFKPAIILISASILPSVQRYFLWLGNEANQHPVLGISPDCARMFIGVFLLLGMLPVFIIRFVFRERLDEYGLAIGDWRTGVRVVAVLFPLIAVFLLYPSTFNPEMRHWFPYDKSAGDSLASFIRFEALHGVLFYTAWEFFFRGFLLFGLRRHVGDTLAVCIQTIPSCLWHIGGPGDELFSSIAAGILFGVIALRTRSILWPFTLHFLIGVATDFLMITTSAGSIVR